MAVVRFNTTDKYRGGWQWCTLKLNTMQRRTLGLNTDGGWQWCTSLNTMQRRTLGLNTEGGWQGRVPERSNVFRELMPKKVFAPTLVIELLAKFKLVQALNEANVPSSRAVSFCEERSKERRLDKPLKLPATSWSVLVE